MLTGEAYRSRVKGEGEPMGKLVITERRDDRKSILRNFSEIAGRSLNCDLSVSGVRCSKLIKKNC